MRIRLTPAISNAPGLALVKSGDSLTVNGIVCDFAPLRDGVTLPNGAVTLPHALVGDVSRVGDEVIVNIIRPYKHGQAVPAPVELVAVPDGNVEIPA